MTKDEAMEKIKHARYHGSFEESQRQIRAIIDQIDQPGELSVPGLCDLILSTHNNHPDLSVELFGDRSWICETFHGGDLDSLRAKLIDLARPPEPSEPKTAPCGVPVEWLKRWAGMDATTSEERLVKANAKAALEKVEVQ